MKITTKLNYLRIAPRKTRLVSDLIRGLPVKVAKAQLMLSPKRSSSHLLKLLHSAISNAKNNHQLEESKLYVKEIKVDKGPVLKRWRPRARGAVSMIEKKTSHITLVLGTSDKLKQQEYVFPEKVVKEKKPEKERKKERKTIPEGKHAAAEGKPRHGQDPKDKEPAEVETVQDKKPSNIKKEKFETKSVKKDISSIRKFFRRKSV